LTYSIQGGGKKYLKKIVPVGRWERKLENYIKRLHKEIGFGVWPGFTCLRTLSNGRLPEYKN
jgi:hypothetical protein